MDRIFNIDSGNGSIFTSKLLDRETLLWHNITVIATEISKSNVTPQLSPNWWSECPGKGWWSKAEIHHHVLTSYSIHTEGKSPVMVCSNASSRQVLIHSQMQGHLQMSRSSETIKWECISQVRLNWYILDLIPKSFINQNITEAAEKHGLMVGIGRGGEGNQVY